jgi:hypothetical protein
MSSLSERRYRQTARISATITLGNPDDSLCSQSLPADVTITKARTWSKRVSLTDHYRR